MINIFDLLNATIGRQEFLLTTEIFSLIFKLVLLVTLIFYSLKKSVPRRFLILLVGFLVGSLMYSDANWIPSNLKQIFLPEIDFRFIALMGRLGWAFFVIQNQSLAMFLESLLEKKFKLKISHYFFLLVSSIILILELYYVIFEFNRPRLSGDDLLWEQRLIQIQVIYAIILLLPTIYSIFKKIKNKQVPKILSHQLKVILPLVIAYFSIELFLNKLFIFYSIVELIPLNKYAIKSLSTLLPTYALYFCARRIMGLRFLNFKGHVESKEKFNFINNFKEILEQLSYATSMKELANITQIFFKAAFSIPTGRVRLYIRKHEEENNNSSFHDIISTTNIVENYLIEHNKQTDPIMDFLQQHKIFIKDEIEFTNFYEDSDSRTSIVNFLDQINADIFLPIYERQKISAYIIIERNARQDKLYTDTERDEMLVFTSYLNNILNILKHSNLDAILKKEKELMDELYQKHQEIKQYKESIRSFIRTNKDRKIGIVFYKNKRFILANQEAQELIGLDINTEIGHPTSQTFKEIANQVLNFKSSKSTYFTSNNASKLIISALPSLEDNNVILLIYYPEIPDLIKSHIDLLKDPSTWDYLLYLETTESGKLINQLIPGNSEILLNLKINLLSTALSKKATILDAPEADLEAMIQILHQISLRETLFTLKLTSEEKNNEMAIKLFGINPLFDSSNYQPILEKLDKIGTLFIQNIDLLNLETQNSLAEFITYGFFYKYKSDYKIFSNVRIICSSIKNLQNSVNEGKFSKNLFNELKKASIAIPSLNTLPDNDIVELAKGFTNSNLTNETFKNLISLNEKETHKLLDQKPISLLELKDRVHELIVNKSNKTQIVEKSEYFNPAYQISDPEIAQAIRLGKYALKDQRIMQMLWDKYKNQNKIATILGVNRSSVNRRCQQFNLK